MSAQFPLRISEVSTWKYAGMTTLYAIWREPYPKQRVRKLSCGRWRGLRSWQVLADTPGAKLWFHGVDRTIRSPLYQIEETDWGFLKRLASRLHTVLVPEWKVRSFEEDMDEKSARGIDMGRN